MVDAGKWDVLLRVHLDSDYKCESGVREGAQCVDPFRQSDCECKSETSFWYSADNIVENIGRLPIWSLAVCHVAFKFEIAF